MTLGIDIDDTLVNTKECINSILKNSKKYSNVSNFYELKNDELILLLQENIQSIENGLKIKKGALDVLNYFHDKGIKIVFITARGDKGMDFMIAATEKFFQENKIPFDELIFKKSQKGEACLEKNVDIFIDDMEYVLDEIKSLGTKTLRFSESAVESKHEIITSWQELKEYIDRIRGD